MSAGDLTRDGSSSPFFPSAGGDDALGGHGPLGSHHDHGMGDSHLGSSLEHGIGDGHLGPHSDHGIGDGHLGSHPEHGIGDGHLGPHPGHGIGDVLPSPGLVEQSSSLSAGGLRASALSNAQRAQAGPPSTLPPFGALPAPLGPLPVDSAPALGLPHPFGALQAPPGGVHPAPFPPQHVAVQGEGRKGGSEELAYRTPPSPHAGHEDQLQGSAPPASLPAPLPEPVPASLPAPLPEPVPASLPTPLPVPLQSGSAPPGGASSSAATEPTLDLRASPQSSRQAVDRARSVALAAGSSFEASVNARGADSDAASARSVPHPSSLPPRPGSAGAPRPRPRPPASLPSSTPASSGAASAAGAASASSGNSDASETDEETDEEVEEDISDEDWEVTPSRSSRGRARAGARGARAAAASAAAAAAAVEGVAIAAASRAASPLELPAGAGGRRSAAAARGTSSAASASSRSGGAAAGGRASASAPRSRGGRAGAVTLGDLVEVGLLEPGEGALTVEYKGLTWRADLLPDGGIVAELEGRRVPFSSPSAFSIYVKRLLVPSRKADDGWKTVKHKGQFLEVYKGQLLAARAAVMEKTKLSEGGTDAAAQPGAGGDAAGAAAPPPAASQSWTPTPAAAATPPAGSAAAAPRPAAFGGSFHDGVDDADPSFDAVGAALSALAPVPARRAGGRESARGAGDGGDRPDAKRARVGV